MSSEGEVMDWKAHLLFGVAAGFVFANFALSLSAIELAAYLSICGISALLPDLDLRTSKASKVLYLVSAAAILAFAFSLQKTSLHESLFVALSIFGLLFILDIFLRPRHRGITHTFVFLFAVTLVAYFLSDWLWASALFVGYFSHLIADRCLKLI
ncbi:MAG: metal-dependent hydrolase [Candidatus Anstonellaceae archaeon]